MKQAYFAPNASRMVFLQSINTEGARQDRTLKTGLPPCAPGKSVIRLKAAGQSLSMRIIEMACHVDHNIYHYDCIK